jgi:hypothetical protein
MPLVKIYHCTDQESAENIMREGFRDPIDPWRSIQQLLPYPFFSDRPIEKIDGAKGSTVIEVIIETTPEEMWGQFDTKDGRCFREFLIPSARINHCPRRILTAEEVEEAIDRGGWEEYPPGEPDRFYEEYFADNPDELEDDSCEPDSEAGIDP